MNDCLYCISCVVCYKTEELISRYDAKLQRVFFTFSSGDVFHSTKLLKKTIRVPFFGTQCISEKCNCC